jgi:hypothetical protein
VNGEETEKLALCSKVGARGRKKKCFEDILGSRGVTPSFLTLALDGGEW